MYTLPFVIFLGKLLNLRLSTVNTRQTNIPYIYIYIFVGLNIGLVYVSFIPPGWASKALVNHQRKRKSHRVHMYI